MLVKTGIISAFLFVSASSFAGITQVWSPAEMGANDLIDWKQFGPNGTVLDSGVHGTTTNGIGFTLYSSWNGSLESGPAFETHTQGEDFDGLFDPGTTVLDLFLHGDWHQPRHTTQIIFDQKVAGVGAKITPGLSIEYISLAWGHAGEQHQAVSVGGFNFRDGLLPVPFLGMLNDKADLDFYTATGLIALTDDMGEVMSNVSIRDTVTVPEPASMAALGLGIAALLRKRNKQR